MAKDRLADDLRFVKALASEAAQVALARAQRVLPQEKENLSYVTDLDHDLERLIRDLAAQGKAVVFSSHLLSQAAALCDWLAILGGGRLLAEGTPRELLGAEAGQTPGPSALERLYLEKLHAHD
jgi:ABC-type Na+ transport system ATPase subunit NatA